MRLPGSNRIRSRLLVCVRDVAIVITFYVCYLLTVKVQLHRLIWTFSSRIEWAASSKKVSSKMRKMHRFKSFCVYAKYHPGLCSSFMHSAVSNDSVSILLNPWLDFADAQADLGLYCPHMPGDIFSKGAANIVFVTKSNGLTVTEDYRTNPKYCGRKTLANSVDPDQTPQNAVLDRLEGRKMDANFRKRMVKS